MTVDPQPGPGEVTRILRSAAQGDGHALDRVFPLVYQELQRIARRQRAGQPPGRTVTTTVLVHEVYLRLADHPEARFEDRVRFYAYAARVMRAVLVDEARARGARKRGGGWMPVELEDRHLAVQDQADLVLALDEALTRLAAEDPQLVRVVECRFFGGMTDEEVARELGVSDRTVRRDWIKARTWLHGYLADSSDGSPP